VKAPQPEKTKNQEMKRTKVVLSNFFSELDKV